MCCLVLGSWGGGVLPRSAWARGLQRGRIQPYMGQPGTCGAGMGCTHSPGVPGGALGTEPPGIHQAGGEHPAPPRSWQRRGTGYNPGAAKPAGPAGARGGVGAPAPPWHSGGKGPRYPVQLAAVLHRVPPVSSLGPQQPSPCTPKCLGSPVLAWKLAPNAGCLALGSPPSRHKVAAWWEWLSRGACRLRGPPAPSHTPVPLGVGAGCWLCRVVFCSGVPQRGQAGPAPPPVQTGLWRIRALPALPSKCCHVPCTHGGAPLSWPSPKGVQWVPRVPGWHMSLCRGTCPPLPRCFAHPWRLCARAATAWEALPDPGFLGSDNS